MNARRDWRKVRSEVKVFVENDQTVTTSYTLGTNKTASTVSPSLNSGVVITVPANATLVVL